MRLANAPFAPERILGSAETASSVGKVLIALSGSGFDRHDDRRPPVGSGVENVEFALLAQSGLGIRANRMSFLRKQTRSSGTAI